MIIEKYIIQKRQKEPLQNLTSPPRPSGLMTKPDKAWGTSGKLGIGLTLLWEKEYFIRQVLWQRRQTYLGLSVVPEIWDPWHASSDGADKQLVLIRERWSLRWPDPKAWRALNIPASWIGPGNRLETNTSWLHHSRNVTSHPTAIIPIEPQSPLTNRVSHQWPVG